MLSSSLFRSCRGSAQHTRCMSTLGRIAGVPEEHLKRTVRVYKPAKTSMQSGLELTKQWKIEFERGERWSNPLMGWTSTADPLSNMNLEFESKEAAIEFVEKHGWTASVDEPQERKPKKIVNSYADKFNHGRPLGYANCERKANDLD